MFNHKKDSKEIEKRRESASRVTWGGGVVLEDPNAYFRGSPAVKRHLDFLESHKETMKAIRQARKRPSVK